MARAFTVYFPFKGKTYAAVIYPAADHLEIYLPDDSLHSILPRGRISLQRQQPPRIETLQPQLAQELVAAILKLIHERGDEAPELAASK